MALGWRGKVACANACHPSLALLGQAVDPMQWVSLLVLQRRAVPSTVPSIQHIWGQVGLPGPPIPAEHPKKAHLKEKKTSHCNNQMHEVGTHHLEAGT